MSLEAVGAILLGWLLGLLGPIIVGASQRRYREKEVREGILTELRDLRLRMAAAVYKLESRFGTYDRNLLQWLVTVFEAHTGPSDSTSILELLRKHAGLDDAQLQAVAERLSADASGGLGVKKYHVPYLDSKMGELGIFAESERAMILDIRAQLALFNEEVDEARMYHKMTFDMAGSTVNHSIAETNVANAYRNLAKRARQVADRIDRVVQ
jgi:hypothetical protein